VHLAQAVGAAGIEEDPLGDGRLPGVDVGDDPDVAGFLEAKEAGHGGTS
jgi:hypothetical protein